MAFISCAVRAPTCACGWRPGCHALHFLVLVLALARSAASAAHRDVRLGLYMPASKDLTNVFTEDQGDFFLASSAMSLLAVDHFNARDPTVLPVLSDAYSLDKCPIQLNATLVDTGYTATNVMSQYVKRYSDPAMEFDAVVGAARSACSMPLATLVGIDQIPMVSYWSTSAKLEDKGAYPTFLRTIPSDSAVSFAAANLFDGFGYDTVCPLLRRPTSPSTPPPPPPTHTHTRTHTHTSISPPPIPPTTWRPHLYIAGRYRSSCRLVRPGIRRRFHR